MNKDKFFDALRNNVAKYEVIFQEHLSPPKIVVIVSLEKDKKFVENYLYENLGAVYGREVILKDRPKPNEEDIGGIQCKGIKK